VVQAELVQPRRDRADGVRLQRHRLAVVGRPCGALADRREDLVREGGGRDVILRAAVAGHGSIPLGHIAVRAERGRDFRLVRRKQRGAAADVGGGLGAQLVLGQSGEGSGAVERLQAVAIGGRVGCGRFDHALGVAAVVAARVLRRRLLVGIDREGRYAGRVGQVQGAVTGARAGLPGVGVPAGLQIGHAEQHIDRYAELLGGRGVLLLAGRAFGGRGAAARYCECGCYDAERGQAGEQPRGTWGLHHSSGGRWLRWPEEIIERSPPGAPELQSFGHLGLPDGGSQPLRGASL
jgi:hypothetical protein